MYECGGFRIDIAQVRNFLWVKGLPESGMPLVGQSVDELIQDIPVRFSGVGIIDLLAILLLDDDPREGSGINEHLEFFPLTIPEPTFFPVAHLVPPDSNGFRSFFSQVHGVDFTQGDAGTQRPGYIQMIRFHLYMVVKEADAGDGNYDNQCNQQRKEDCLFFLLRGMYTVPF